MGIAKENISKCPAVLRTKNLKNGTQSLYIDVYIKGVRKTETLKMYLLPEADDKAVRANKAILAEAEKLVKKRNRELQKELKSDRRTIEDMAQVKELLEPQDVSLAEWMERYREIQKSKGVKGLRHIKTTAGLLAEFRPEAMLKEIDKNFCLDFQTFLQEKRKVQDGQPFSSKTVFNYMGEFSTALNTAVRMGVIFDNPYLKLASSEKVKPKENIREYLSIEELKRLIDTPCTINEAKQLFLFATYCGLRYGDLENLTWGDISEKEGKRGISVVMSKTSRPVYIPIGEQAMVWMPERGNATGETKVFGGLPSRTKVATALDKWAEEAGIAKPVTLHVARHSFATSLLTLGADLYTVSKLLGHTSVKHTQRYAKIIDKKKDDAVALIDKYFEGREQTKTTAENKK